MQLFMESFERQVRFVQLWPQLHSSPNAAQSLITLISSALMCMTPLSSSSFGWHPFIWIGNIYFYSLVRLVVPNTEELISQLFMGLSKIWWLLQNRMRTLDPNFWVAVLKRSLLFCPCLKLWRNPFDHVWEIQQEPKWSGFFVTDRQRRTEEEE